MWHLRFKYKHSDCIYAPKLKELNISGFFYYLGEYTKAKSVYTSAMQHLVGDEKQIKKYIGYMKNHKNIKRIEVYGDIIFTLAKHRKELKIYENVYNPIFIYPSPAYLDKEGFEIIEVASWNRKDIEELIKSIEKTKTTEHFEIIYFINKEMEDIYVSKLLPKLPKKQKESIILAFKNGYYKFPRQTNLDKLAKIVKVSKPTFRENLRKAESKIIPNLILE